MALPLSLVTPLSTLHWCCVLGVLVAVYTCIGGLTGVIWTDVFQAIVMLCGLVAVFIKVF